MPSSIAIRPISMADYKRVAEIYSDGIAERIATFETKPRGWDDIQLLVESDPIFLVSYNDVDFVTGFVRVSPTSSRRVYAGVGEISVYVDPNHRGQGIGRQLINYCHATAGEQGFWKLIAKIFPENKSSLELFRNTGYRDVGIHVKHGQLDGQWRDVCLLEALLHTEE